MKKIFFISCMLVMAFCANTSIFAQTKEQEAEISSDVPALKGFHTIIFPMWHKAYPAKDYAAIKGFVPQIKENMENMNKAVLPGILRDKEAQWKEELAKFNTVAEQYYKACADDNQDAMLKAAENFHRAYEGMNRVVKPFNPEMDAYHQTLYVIYHKLYPENNYKAIAALMPKFVPQAEALLKTDMTKMEKRLKDKTPKYTDASKELIGKTIALKNALENGNKKQKKDAVEKLHISYKKLEAVFE